MGGSHGNSESIINTSIISHSTPAASKPTHTAFVLFWLLQKRKNKTL